MLEHLCIEDYSCLCCLSTGKHAGLAQDLQQNSNLCNESRPYSSKLENTEVLTVRWCAEVTTFYANSSQSVSALRLVQVECNTYKHKHLRSI